MLTWWLKAFVVTQVIEVPTAWLVLRVHPSERIATRRVILGAVTATCLTHPVLWLAYVHLPWVFQPYWLAVWAFEILITLVEALILWSVLRPTSPWTALIVSAAMNMTSFAAGVFLGPWLFT